MIDQQIKTKICTKCKQEKELTSEFFAKRKGVPDGFKSQCKVCDKKYYEENKQKILDQKKKYYEENLDQILEYKKRYWEDNKSQILERHNQYYLQNKEKIITYHRRYEKQRALIDPLYNLRKNIARLIRFAINASGNSKAGQSVIQHLPYTVEQLKQHLELLFEEGMSWDNYGEWHIDHIIPSAYFSYQSMSDPEFLECWSLDNLRPLWANENMSKNSLYDGVRWKYAEYKAKNGKGKKK